MAENTPVPSTSSSSIPDRSMIYPGYYTRSQAYPPIPSSSSVALLTETMQPSAEDLEELQEDFFYEGQRVVNERTCSNIEDSNVDISALYQHHHEDELSSPTTQRAPALPVSITI